MNPATLREQVVIEHRVTARDAAGQPIESWAASARLWARVESVAGSEAVAGGQVTAEATHRITIRHWTGVTPHCRVDWQGDKLDVLSVADPDGRRREMVLVCRQVVD